MRVAIVKNARSLGEVEAYLPSNYEVLLWDGEVAIIAGKDNAGWTMDSYVIPRFASGLISCKELR